MPNVSPGFSRLLAVATAAVLVCSPLRAEAPDKAPSPPPVADHGADAGGGKGGKPSGKAGGEAKPHAAKPGKPANPDTPEQRTHLLSDLYAHLATTDDAADTARIVDAIERLWAFSGSPTIDVLMERAAVAAAAKNNELALKLLDAVVDLAPDFAEGWNRRAYVHYTMNDYERALGDLRRAVALEPNHFKAIEGIAQIFKETGRKKAALGAFKQLLQINPNAAGAKEAVEELSRDVEGQGI